MTFHNRKALTLKCLDSLFSAMQIPFDVYACDDGSTDGTAGAILGRYSKVHVIKGDGTLYWNRGMLCAWKAAASIGYQYYLWLNDDTILHDDFWNELSECSSLVGGKCVVSGLVQEAATGQIIYGGTDHSRGTIQRSAIPTDIEHMNGNVVLVPNEIVQVVGLLDPNLHHDLGDVDYGLRVRKAGFRVVSTRHAIADGVRNDFCRVRKWGTNLKGRFTFLFSPLGGNPRVNVYFRKKHYGWGNAYAYSAYLLLLNLLPDVAITLLFGSKYKDH